MSQIALILKITHGTLKITGLWPAVVHLKSKIEISANKMSAKVMESTIDKHKRILIL